MKCKQHNHPSTQNFWLDDIYFFLTYATVQVIVVVSNQGTIHYICKDTTYDYSAAFELFKECTKNIKKTSFAKTHYMAALSFLVRCSEVGLYYIKRRFDMNIIIIGVLGVLISSFILSRLKYTKKIQKLEGVLYSGEIVSLKTIVGRPNRYVIEINVEDNKTNAKGKVITTNCKCKQYEIGDRISLLYVSRWDQYYWIEDINKKITFLKIFLWMLISFFLIFMVGGIIALYF